MDEMQKMEVDLHQLRLMLQLIEEAALNISAKYGVRYSGPEGMITYLEASMRELQTQRDRAAEHGS